MATTTTPEAAVIEGLPAPAGSLDRFGRLSLVTLRITLGLLWLTNAGWKRPPDFGEASGSGLFRFTSFAIEHPVFPPYTWLVETVVLPNFRVFGWVVLFTEALLGACLLLGLLTRFWGVVGVAMSLAIALSERLPPLQRRTSVPFQPIHTEMSGGLAMRSVRFPFGKSAGGRARAVS